MMIEPRLMRESVSTAVLKITIIIRSDDQVYQASAV